MYCRLLPPLRVAAAVVLLRMTKYIRLLRVLDPLPHPKLLF